MTRLLIQSVIFSVLLTVFVLFMLLQYLQYRAENHLPPAEVSDKAWAAADQDMVIHFINLDIGKSTLIQMGDQGVLVDVGHQKDASDLLEYLEKRGITLITGIFLSNPGKENIGALEAIIQHFPMAKVYVPALTSDLYDIPAKAYLVSIQAGDQIELSEERGIRLDILAPLSPIFGNLYNDSLVSLLSYRDIRILLMNDIREEAEERLMKKYPQLEAEVMTVPDRPSGVLHSNRFIEKINPQTAVMIEMPCPECKEIVKDAASRYSLEWSDFFFVPIGQELIIPFDEGVYTTPKSQLD